MDLVNGNDVVHNAFGTSAAERHRQFNYIFAVQDPMIPIPCKKGSKSQGRSHVCPYTQSIF